MDNNTALLMIGLILNAASIQARAYIDNRRRGRGRDKGDGGFAL